MSLGNGWILLCATALVSALLTAATRYYALRRNLLDAPGRRRSHAVLTPRGGGMGPILAMLLLGAGWAEYAHAPLEPSVGCVLGLVFVAAIGWLDDHRALPVSWRLAVHIVAATIAAVAVLGLPTTVTQWALLLVAIAWITGLVNAWNFMDGIDGIATTQAILVVTTMLCGGALFAWLGTVWMVASWIVLGALVGFVPFNFPRARIFLGDVGSGALGFVIACLLLRAVVHGGMPWPLALVAVSAFGVDATLTLGKRIVQGKAWWRPHREHLYQWLVRCGRSHALVTLIYAGWTTIACTLVLTVARASTPVATWTAIGALSCAWLLWFGVRRRLARR